jgi:hypothetical protein
VIEVQKILEVSFKSSIHFSSGAGMKIHHMFFGIALVLSLVILSVSCGGDDDDDNDDSDDDGAAVWTDETTDLMWQTGDNPVLEWLDAVDYCDNLELGGYSDWRLPNLDELRSLIRGCEATMTGGECGLTNDCTGSVCDSDACNGCEAKGGPGIDGYYQDEALDADTGIVWSSTDVAQDTSTARIVTFWEASIGEMAKAGNELTVRCVR